MTRCRASRASSVPNTLTSTGCSRSCLSSMIVDSLALFHSTQETRSFGILTVPLRSSPMFTVRTSTLDPSTAEPSIIVTLTCVRPLGSNTSKNSLRRSTGVNRQSSCLRVGTGNVSTSNERGAVSALDGMAAGIAYGSFGSATGMLISFGSAIGQPTDPSICNSTKRLSSSAYSMGSSRLIGSTNPRTIIAMASFSSMPRLIR